MSSFIPVQNVFIPELEVRGQLEPVSAVFGQSGANDTVTKRNQLPATTSTLNNTILVKSHPAIFSLFSVFVCYVISFSSFV